MAVNTIVEQYYEAFANHQPTRKDLISEQVTFEGPTQKTDNIVDFIALSEQFQQFVKEAKLLRCVVDNNTVSSEFEYRLS